MVISTMGMAIIYSVGEHDMMGNGRKVCVMGTVCVHLKMEIFMKVSGHLIFGMVVGSVNSAMEMCTV